MLLPLDASGARAVGTSQGWSLSLQEAMTSCSSYTQTISLREKSMISMKIMCLAG